MKGRVLKEYIPRSWFHPKGIYKVVERLKPKLPNVNGCLFVTLTLDRNAFKEQWIIPSQAYDQTRGHIRKIFHKLRKGVLWEGKEYKISSPYCVKVEFHDDPEGWPHYHIIWLSRSFVPSELITSLWTHGRTNIKRINNKEFKEIPNHLSLLSYDLVGLVYYLSSKSDLINKQKIFKEENSFKGKIGIFDIENNKINHRLNFYQISDGELKEIF